MASSSAGVALPHITRDIVGFVVGKYFALTPEGTPDYNGITRNIDEACVWAKRLCEVGALVFTPHLNTHHFEQKTRIDADPLENEEYYRAFDRKLLAKGVDFVYATPNWRQSTGGRLEVQVANLLKIPVFESVADVLTWASGQKSYSTVAYKAVSKEAKNFGSKKDMKIVVVDGPYWVQDGSEPDLAAIKANIARAEAAAVGLFNGKVGAFTPHLNGNPAHMGHRMPLDLHERLTDRMLEKVADGMFVTEGWETVPRVRKRVASALKAGKPVFNSHNELFAWRDGRTDYVSVRIG